MRRTVLGCLLVLFAIPAMGADPEGAKASYKQANEYFDGFRFADAATAYGRAIELDPQYVEAYFNRALADEMVERRKAIAEWQKFVEVAANSADYSSELGQAKARIQGLEMLPAYPVELLPSHYVAASGDYYKEVAEDSESAMWRAFPLKVYIGGVPNADWAQGTREAFRIWKSMFPLELTAEVEEADIVFDWQSSTEDSSHPGEETEWVRYRRVGDSVSGRRVAHIAIDLRQGRSKDEIRAIVLHEMGHALGIHAHSESKTDIMYFQVQKKSHQIPIPGVIFPVSWKSLVSKPSQRDINTLIRLYNTPGSVVRLH